MLKGALYVGGPPGTGKSASVDYALKEVAQMHTSAPFATVRLNCMKFQSARSMVLSIVAEYELHRDANFSGAALSSKAVSSKVKALGREWRGSHLTPSERMRDIFTAGKEKILLVLDEVDRFKYFMEDVFALANDAESSLALIGITNDVDPHRVLHGLAAECAFPRDDLLYTFPPSSHHLTHSFPLFFHHALDHSHTCSHAAGTCVQTVR